MRLRLGLLALAFLSATLSSTVLADQKILKVFTAKDPKEWVSVLDAFTQDTGVKLDVVVGTHDELVAKLAAGETADVFITKDLVYLRDAVTKDLYQPMQSGLAEALTNPVMRHPSKLWVGLTYRARVIMYDPAVTSVTELSTYEDLADPKWAGKLCLRESNNSYNQGLVAGLIGVFGEEWTRKVVSGWLDNLGQEPFKGDTKVLEAINDGRCKVGVTNTYYLAGLIKKDPTFKVRPFFPNQDSTGAMTNGGGMGVLKVSTQPELASKFIEHLLSKPSQEAMVATSNEYPVNAAANATDIVKSFGNFKVNGLPWSEAGKHVTRAKRIMREEEWP